jgi:hypothetical protein
LVVGWEVGIWFDSVRKIDRNRTEQKWSAVHTTGTKWEGNRDEKKGKVEVEMD